MRWIVVTTGVWAAVLSAPAAAHECVAGGPYAQCSDGTTYTWHGGAVVGSDGTTIIRTPDGVYIGHQHPAGPRYAPVRDPRSVKAAAE